MTAATTDRWSPAYADTDPERLAPAHGPGLRGVVLVAADESELAGNAARVALAVARRFDRPIRVVHVADTRGLALLVPPSTSTPTA